MGLLKGFLFARWLVVLLSLCGCDQRAIFEKFVPQEETALTKELIAKLAARDLDAVEGALEPSLRTPEARQKLEEIARLLPPGAPKTVEVVGATTRQMPSATTYDLTLEYQYASSWVLANAVLVRNDGKVTVQRIHLLPRSQSMEAENRFTFEGKGALHYVVVAMAIAIPLLIVYAAVVCLMSKIPRGKWLWVLFIVVGLAQLQLNWTTGAWEIRPLQVSLLGAGYTRLGPVGPYILQIALPVGAIVFLTRRRSFGLVPQKS